MTTLSSTKGQTALDGLLIIVMLFVFGIVIVWGYQFISEINEDFQADPDMATEAKTSMAGYVDKWPGVWDQAFAWLLGLLWVVLILSSFLIDSHPAFFVITIIVLLFVFVAAMELSNEYEEFMNEDELTEYSSGFPMTNWIMSHLLLIMIVMLLTSGLTLYAKERS